MAVVDVLDAPTEYTFIRYLPPQVSDPPPAHWAVQEDEVVRRDDESELPQKHYQNQ